MRAAAQDVMPPGGRRAWTKWPGGPEKRLGGCGYLPAAAGCEEILVKTAFSCEPSELTTLLTAELGSRCSTAASIVPARACRMKEPRHSRGACAGERRGVACSRSNVDRYLGKCYSPGVLQVRLATPLQCSNSV